MLAFGVSNSPGSYLNFLSIVYQIFFYIFDRFVRLADLYKYEGLGEIEMLSS